VTRREEPKKVNPVLTAEDNQLELPDGRIITFNEQQASALEGINTFLNSAEEQFFTLSGFAGTGKTTIILKTLETTLDRKRVAVSAPTHKAKKVIRATTKRSAETIHALLGLKPNFDVMNLDPKNLEFARDPRQKVPRMAGYKVVIIDEASMLNSSMVDMIKEVAGKYGTKVIFMGDQAQIPPVGEKLSKVFMPEFVGNSAHLDKVERQADGNPLFTIFDAIREDQRSPVDKFDHLTAVNEKKEGVWFANSETWFTNQMINAFTSDEYGANPESVKVITWTNAQAAKWNKIIRRARMGEDATFLEEGDILMAHDSVMEDHDMVIENSAEYRVVEKSERVLNRDVFQKDGIEGYWVTLETLDERPISVGPVYVVDPAGPNLQKVDEKLGRLRKQALERGGGSAWRPFFEFKESIVLTKNIGNMSKTLDYGYAVTTHKAQGSTYTSVFVDEDNMDRNRWSHQRHVVDRKKKGLEPMTREDIDTERNKIKYVALSRPSQNAIVLSNKAGDGRNTHVDKPVIAPVDPNETLDDVVGDGEGEVIASLTLPQEFVSDKDVIEFMKQCK
jgi:exodeoxyribonuclease-5